MKQEQQQQAQRLYFQTDLSKTQIADSLGISRRTLHYWIKENSWERLRHSAAIMPSFIAEDCYQVMSQFTRHLLSPERADKPVTPQEATTLHKISQTISKLKDRTTLNESMDLFAHFMEDVNRKAPSLAPAIQDLITGFVTRRASSMPAYIATEQDPIEAQLDAEDMAAWAEDGFKPEEAAPQTAPAAAPAPAGKPYIPSYQTITNQPFDHAKVKYDLRKALRGTSKTGPGKAFHKSKAAQAA